MKVNYVSGPRALENLDTLVGHRAALSIRQTQHVELLLHPTGADSQYQTAVGEQIDRGKLTRVAQRISIWSDQNARTQLERGGAGRHRTHRHRRIQHIVPRLVGPLSRSIGDMSTARSGRHAYVVGEPHRVETGCFGKLRDSDRPHFFQRSGLQEKVVLVPITDAVRGSVDSDV